MAIEKKTIRLLILEDLDDVLLGLLDRRLELGDARLHARLPEDPRLVQRVDLQPRERRLNTFWQSVSALLQDNRERNAKHFFVCRVSERRWKVRGVRGG